MTNKGKFDIYNLIIAGSILTVSILAAYIYTTLNKSKIGSLNIPTISGTYLSPYILEVSNESHQISGVISELTDKNIVIDYLPSTSLVDTNPKPLKFEISYTSETPITVIPAPIPYRLRAIPPENPMSPTAPTLKKGDFVTINTNSDLRTTDPKKVVASQINIASKIYNIIGSIVSSNGNSISIKGVVTASDTPGNINAPDVQETQIEFTVDDKTEISESGSRQAVKLTDIDKFPSDSTVTVFTDSNLSQSNSGVAKMIIFSLPVTDLGDNRVRNP